MAKHRTTEQQLAAAEAQLNKLRKKQRQEDTRRKVLIGAMHMSRCERDDSAHHQLMRDMYAATLQPTSQPAGWSLGVTLKADHDQLQSILG